MYYDLDLFFASNPQSFYIHIYTDGIENYPLNGKRSLQIQEIVLMIKFFFILYFFNKIFNEKYEKTFPSTLYN